MKKKQRGKTKVNYGLPTDIDDYHIIKPVGFFHIYETQKDLEKYFKNFSGNESFLVHLGATLQWNCLAYQLKGEKLIDKRTRDLIAKSSK